MTQARPWFVLVAGINGAGKSTLAQNSETIRALCGLMDTSDEIEIINPDLITKKLLERDPQPSTAAPNIPFVSPKSATTGSPYFSATLSRLNLKDFGHG